MTVVTLILNQIEEGDATAASKLLPVVYQELRTLAEQRMSSERPDHTLQPTALVHEAYLRLVDAKQVEQWNSRAHFFTAAANAMRQILIESARTKNALKRGGDWKKMELSEINPSANNESRDELILIDEALTILQEEDVDAAEIVKLRLYTGLTVEEAGKVLKMSRSTAYENWSYARSWFSLYFEEANQD